MPRAVILLLALLALATVFGVPVHCFAADPTLILQPAELELRGPFGRHQLLVTHVDAEGQATDVTGQAQFESQAPAIAQVSSSGECQAIADGTTQIAVRFGGLSANATVNVRETAAVQTPSFAREVVPLLTRLGCNQGACHGKGAGQNGFRLSLRGYAPEWDYEWIVREYAGRRVVAPTPEESLLLRKAGGAVPHGGGKLFNAGSREHDLLLRWVAAGSPPPAAHEAEVVELELLPGARTLRVGEEQRLIARAKFSDGRWEDVTWLTQFASNDAGTIEVTPAGTVRALREGETAVRAHCHNQVAVAILTVPHQRAVPETGLAAPNNLVDVHVFNKLKQLRIPPSSPATDEEFLRRAYIDTIGMLPSPEEVREFLADAGADKRTRLIEHLLSRPEFDDYWTLQLGDLFQNRRERDHDVRGAKGVRAFHEWLRQQVKNNRPWNQLVREVLTATGKSTEHPAVGYYIVTVGERGQAEQSEVVASVAQAFLGVRIGCAQCHNHPLEKFTQDDYYHFAAFFTPVKFQRQEPQKGATTLTVALPEGTQQIGASQPRTGKLLAPQPLDRSSVALAPGDDPRVKLVDWMTDPKNEYFSGAIVNRIWRHYLGVGLVEPVDDLRASNPPSNTELWQALRAEFVGQGYDLRQLMRLILNSRTYQLSSATVAENETDDRFYSHYYARRLPAEVLLDSISQATGVPDNFTGYPLGVRAVQLPDPALDSYFLTLFGRSQRTTACACERVGEVTISQLLHLQNGEAAVQKISAPDGRLEQLLAATSDDNTVIDELYLATFTRTPTAEERTVLTQAIVSAENRKEGLRDLFWALLNSKDFAFNH